MPIALPDKQMDGGADNGQTNTFVDIYLLYIYIYIHICTSGGARMFCALKCGQLAAATETIWQKLTQSSHQLIIC